MKKLLNRCKRMAALLFSVCMALSLLPETAGAEDAAGGVTNSLQFSKATYTYDEGSPVVQLVPGAVAGIAVEMTVTGPANVCRAVLCSVCSSLPTEKGINDMIRQSLPVVKESDLPAQQLPFAAYDNVPVYPQNVGKTLYVVFYGLDKDYNAVGYALVSLTAGGSGTAVAVEPAGGQSEAPETPEVPETPQEQTESEIIASGQMGDNVFWALDVNGLLIVSGTGPMWDEEDPWAHRVEIDRYSNSTSVIKRIKVTNGVTTIGQYAFSEEPQLKEVDIADSVTVIGRGAFQGDYDLVALKLPKNLIILKENVFCNCGGLSDIELPNSVIEIGAGAFAGCKKTVHITIPSQIKIINSSTFCRCSILKSVGVPISVTEIKKGAFADCPSLTDVYYAGTKAQWDKIQIDNYKNWNDALLSATIHYGASSTDTAITVTVNGSPVQWTDAAPFIDENSRTMVPLRAVGDALGLTVGWDGSKREASFSDGTKTIYFPIGSTTARTSDGKTIQMDTAAVIVNDRTYAPVRYLAEFFGHTVEWDGATRTVIIK